jgi:hypothetical protein
MRRFKVLIAAVAVLALAAPPIANAHAITSSAGKLAPVGTVVSAEALDFVFVSETFGKTTCKSVHFNVKLTKNDGSTVEGSSGAETAPAQDCTTIPVNITSLEITKFVASAAETSLSFKMVADFPFECTLTGTKVPFTYIPGDDKITFTFALGIIGTPAVCGKFRMEGQFTLKIASTPVILD